MDPHPPLLLLLLLLLLLPRAVYKKVEAWLRKEGTLPMKVQ